MARHTQKRYLFWFLVGLIAALIAAPNTVFIKLAVDAIGTNWFNIIRFSLVILVTAPYIFAARKKITHTNLRLAIVAGTTASLASICFVKAVEMTQASYVSVVALSVPIVLVMYSWYFMKERVSRRAMLGVSVAALGAFVIIAVPLLSSQGLFSSFSLGATLLVALNCALYPLSTIYTRKANEAGLPLGSSIGIMAIIMTISSGFLALLASDAAPNVGVFTDPWLMFGIAYSGVLVLLLSRAMSVASFEHVGSATVAGFSYLESFLSIILPILLLGEHMTIEMAVGGTFILLGVIVVETHLRPHTRHSHHLFRHRL